MTTLIEILSPDFLLRQALIGSVLVGLVCPLVGVYFILRRMIFLGVALPQVSAAGIAFAALVHQIVTSLYAHIALSERWLATIGSMTFTLAGLLVLAAFERQRDTVEARIGIAYVMAAAASMLFLATNPTAEAHMVNLLKGDILATTGLSLTLMVGVFGAVVMVLMAFHKEFLLVSFDRDLAVVFGKRVEWWDMLLYLTIGIAIALGVITAGPIVTFGFLVLPTFTARLITHRMLTFSLTSAGLGAVTAFVGFYCAYRFDLPLGPAEVVVASLVLVLVWVHQSGLPSRRRMVGEMSRLLYLCFTISDAASLQAFAAAGSVGRRGGLLYALNTLGGVLGAAAAGFRLPAPIGVNGAMIRS